MVIIVTFYAGDVIWRERTQKMDDVYDALPASNALRLRAALS